VGIARLCKGQDQASGKQAASFASIVSVLRLCSHKRVAYLIGIEK
jgi:hypothetical protein